MRGGQNNVGLRRHAAAVADIRLQLSVEAEGISRLVVHLIVWHWKGQINARWRRRREQIISREIGRLSRHDLHCLAGRVDSASHGRKFNQVCSGQEVCGEAGSEKSRALAQESPPRSGWRSRAEENRSEERRVGKEGRSRWSPY